MDIQWDSAASLMRVAAANTTDLPEELVKRGTVRDLVEEALGYPAEAQRGLLIRASGPDWSEEYDEAAIRELAAHPGFTGVEGADDTATLPRDQQTVEVAAAGAGGQVIGDDRPANGQVGGPTGVHPRT
jgi:hypothetical protein